MKKPPKPKKPFLSGYKTYNPDVEGFGDASQWQDAFSTRMGLDEAKRVLKDRSPYAVLGVSETASLEEIKTAYRKLAMQHHPDRGGNAEDFKAVQAAYEILAEQYK